MDRCRLSPFVCIFLGLLLLAVGYSLDPETLRKIWLWVSFLMVICGIIMIIAFNVLAKK